MAPARRLRLLPVVLLLAFLIFLFLSLRSVPPTPPISPTHLRSISPPSNFTLLIKLLTFNRPRSLRRCLASLSAASYPPSDAVHLHIYVDHFRDGEDVSAADKGKHLATAREVLEIADRYEWPHGEKMVHYRVANAGLQGQWIEAWWPGGEDEFAFVVEDDTEVSPMYYSFLKGAVARYYYSKENSSPSLFGVTLQRPRFVAGKHGNRITLDRDTRIFLYQMVGTWGQLLFPKPWKEFRLWYDDKKAKGGKPLLQGMVTTSWYKKMGERIWTPWFIKFVHSRGFYNIYTNFLEERALSISHRDAGVNYGKDVGPDSTLVDAHNADFNLLDMPPLRKLKWYDFCFSEVHPNRISRSLTELVPVLEGVQKQKVVVFISLYATEWRLSRNLICHLEKVGIENYIFIDDDSEFSYDLARRGHPVIDANALLSSLDRNSKNLGDHIRESLAKAHIVKECLELGYSLWLATGNMIPLSSQLTEPSNPLLDFFVDEHMDLLFVRNTQISRKSWNNRVMLSLIDHLKSAVPGEHNFLHVLAKSLDVQGQETFGKLSAIPSVELQSIVQDGHSNASISTIGKSIVFWHHPAEFVSVQRDLKRAGLWLLDADSSCSAVVCHATQ